MKTNAYAVQRGLNTRPVHSCSNCGEHFFDQRSFESHKQLATGAGSKCLSPSALWSTGWSKSRPEKKSGVPGSWSAPQLPRTRPHRFNEDDVYRCVLCKKAFNDAKPFMAHFVHTHTKSERCLDTHELRALDFEQGSNGVWRASLVTQLLPSQVHRLPTVRNERKALSDVEVSA